MTQNEIEHIEPKQLLDELRDSAQLLLQAERRAAAVLSKVSRNSRNEQLREYAYRELASVVLLKAHLDALYCDVRDGIAASL